MHRFNNNNLNDSMKSIMILIFITTAYLICHTAAVRAPPPVEINKCCRIGERLDLNQQCSIGDGTEKWWPPIYLVVKQEHFQPIGDAPRFMRVRENKRPNCDNPEFFVSNVALFSNGTLYSAERNARIDLADYCVDKDVALVCLPNARGNADSLIRPLKLTKIRKCCGHQSIYLSDAATCASRSEQHGPIPEHLFQMQNSTHIDLIYGFPVCPPAANHKYVIADHHFREQNLNIKNGIYTLDSHRTLQAHAFCIDHTVQASNVIAEKVFACDDIVADKGVSESKIEEDRRFLIYSIALIISVIFLALTLAIGFLLPSNHHVLHCRCQTYYVGCLLIGDLLLAINQLAGPLITGIPCLAIATLMHFFFLAAFFWLNVMCFNIWWTFRDFRPTTLGKKQEKIRLRIYKIYAWGFALLITGIAAIMDNLPHSHDLLRPRFGEKKCWFVGDMEIFVYFLGPIGFLLLVNIIFFASTTRQLMCGLWKQDDVKSSTERAALGRVCMKLVVVMGITWIADVLSWAHSVWMSDSNNNNNNNNNMNVETHEVRYYFWYIMDAINALQGVLIFFVVVMQPQVTTAIIRFFTPKNSRSKLNTAHGQHHSSSSNGLGSVGDSMANNTFNNTACSKVPMETIC